MEEYLQPSKEYKDKIPYTSKIINSNDKRDIEYLSLIRILAPYWTFTSCVHIANQHPHTQHQHDDIPTLHEQGFLFSVKMSHPRVLSITLGNLLLNLFYDF